MAPARPRRSTPPAHRVGAPASFPRRTCARLLPSTGPATLPASSSPASSTSVGSTSTSETGVGTRLRRKSGRTVEHERHPFGPLEEGAQAPETALSQHVAVVGGDDDDGVAVETGGLECAEDLPDPVVNVTEHRVVGVTCPANMRVGHAGLPHAAVLIKMATQFVVGIDRDRRYRRHGDVPVLVTVPVSRPARRREDGAG